MTISCQPDGRPPQPFRPWKSGRVHLAEGSNVVVLEQEIRFIELGVCQMQLFSFFDHVMKIGWFFYGDVAIGLYRFSKWRPSAILELFCHYTRPLTKSLLLAAAACQMSCQSDTQIRRYSYLNFRLFGLKCLFRPQNEGFGGLWTPKCDYSSSRPQKERHILA